MSTVLSSRAQVTGSYTTLARKFDISHWFPCGADKRAYGSRDYQNFSDG